MFDFLISVVKEDVIHALNITWKGMLGIFIVMGAIFLIVKLMNYISTGAAAKKELAKKKAAEAASETEQNDNTALDTAPTDED